MTFDELKALPIQNIMNPESCLLFMWVVIPELPKCIEVAEQWGFKYITIAFVWYKQRANVGNYTMSSCELCLLFKKGKIPSDRVRNPGQKQFYSAPVTIHSEKPAEIRDRIMRMYPKSNKIELFSRKEIDGWDAFGNQVKNL